MEFSVGRIFSVNAADDGLGQVVAVQAASRVRCGVAGRLVVDGLQDGCWPACVRRPGRLLTFRVGHRTNLARLGVTAAFLLTPRAAPRRTREETNRSRRSGQGPHGLASHVLLKARGLGRAGERVLTVSEAAGEDKCRCVFVYYV
jgi:hypothetical protein